MKGSWEFSHSGVFARDLDKTVRYYQSLGLAAELGPTRNPFSAADNTVTTVFGKVQPPRDPSAPYFLQLIYIGDLELEVLHAPAERPKGDALAYGEGVNHVCFNVPDIDGETDKLVRKGFRLVLDFKRNGERLENYLDTREFGNVFLSLRTPQNSVMKKRKAGYAIVNWKFSGHGVVVKDVERTAQYYRSMGIATTQPQATFDSTGITDIKAYGRAPRNSIRAKIRTAQIGPVIYEFIQPEQEEDSIYGESLERRGEGVIDLTFTVDDLDRETGKLAEKGVPVIFSGRDGARGAFAYLDTRKDGGDVMIKLVQP